MDFQKSFKSAEKMLQTFSDAGAKYFTVVGEKDNEKNLFFLRRYCDRETIELNLKNDLKTSFKENCNYHIRPYTESNTFVQLDDCNWEMFFLSCVSGGPQANESKIQSKIQAEIYSLVKPFLIIETSSDNFQVWLSFDSRLDKDVVKIIKKIFNSDPGSTGSCRIAGSFNFKEKHKPDFPQVKLVFCDSSATNNIENFLNLDLVCSADQKHRKEKHGAPAPTNPPGGRSISKNNLNAWPFYERALMLAPQNRDGTGVDRSRADYIWSYTALSWGHSIDEVIHRLVSISLKAKEKPYHEAFEYAANTVIRAARQ